jgi:2'-hydroxyisoflavone reductase
MRILMVGGTRFIGRHVVQAALARGHDITVFHRGRTGADLFPEVEHRLGDRNSDLSALADGEWDATVDTCAYLPAQVQTLADALGGRGGHHLLVSSVSAYQPPDGPGLTEDSPLAVLDDPTVEEVTGETYGGLKVLCERAAVERHGPSTLVVRPTYVVGPDDYTWRFPWWVARIAAGGEVLVPGPQDAPAQVIDVRDMADWMVRLLEDGRSGAFHAVSPAPPFTWQQQLEAIAAAVAPRPTRPTIPAAARRVIR